MNFTSSDHNMSGSWGTNHLIRKLIKGFSPKPYVWDLVRLRTEELKHIDPASGHLFETKTMFWRYVLACSPAGAVSGHCCQNNFDSPEGRDEAADLDIGTPGGELVNGF